MDRYGIALAGFKGKVTCNPIKVDVDKATNVSVLQDLAFERGIYRGDIHRDIILPLKRAVQEVVSLQEQSFSQAGREPEPIALYIGGAKGDDFDGWTLLYNGSSGIGEKVLTEKELVNQGLKDALLPPPKTTFEQLMRLTSRHVDREMVRLREEHTESGDIVPFDTSEIESVLDAVMVFRDILSKSLVARGNYNDGGAGPFNDIEVLKLRDPIKKGDSAALAQLKEKAYLEGRGCGVMTSGAGRRYFADPVPPGYHRLPQEERDKYPCSYYGWHPEIEESYHKGFKETYDHKLYKHYQLPIEGQFPPYVTPLRDLIYTQDRISKGIMKEEDLIEEKRNGTIMRDAIVGRLDSAGAFLRETPGKLAQLYEETKSLLSGTKNEEK